MPQLALFLCVFLVGFDLIIPPTDATFLLAKMSLKKLLWYKKLCRLPQYRSQPMCGGRTTTSLTTTTATTAPTTTATTTTTTATTTTATTAALTVSASIVTPTTIAPSDSTDDYYYYYYYYSYE